MMDRYEQQFKALLTAIETGHPNVAKSAAKTERKLKRLECCINYQSKERSATNYKGKERAVSSFS